jgi:hypothetical protein
VWAIYSIKSREVLQRVPTMVFTPAVLLLSSLPLQGLGCSSAIRWLSPGQVSQNSGGLFCFSASWPRALRTSAGTKVSNFWALPARLGLHQPDSGDGHGNHLMAARATSCLLSTL